MTRETKDKMFKALFNLFFTLRVVVLAAVLIIGSVLIMFVFAMIDGSSIEWITFTWLAIEFIAGIAYLIIIYRVRDIVEGKPKKKVKQPVVKKVERREEEPEVDKFAKEVGEARKKAHTEDDVVEDVKSAMYTIEDINGNRKFYKIFSDERVFNMQTERYIGHQTKSGKVFEVRIDGKRVTIKVKDLIKQLF